MSTTRTSGDAITIKMTNVPTYNPMLRHPHELDEAAAHAFVSSALKAKQDADAASEHSINRSKSALAERLAARSATKKGRYV